MLRYLLCTLALSTGAACCPLYAQISAEQTLSIGQNLLDSEDYALAVQYFGKAAQAKPYLSDPYYLRGYAKMMLGDYAGAETDCDKALELNSFLRDPYRVRGICRMQQGKDTSALADFQAGLKQAPDDRTFLYYTALCQAKLGQRSECEATFSRLEKLYPRFTPGFTAHVRSLLAMRDTTAAIALLERTPSKGRNNAELSLMRATIAITQQRWQTAVAAINDALTMMPHSDALYVNRGVSRSMLGDKRGATADFHAALDINPDNRQAASNLKEGKLLLCDIPLPSQAITPGKQPITAAAPKEQPCGMFALTFTHPYDERHPLAYPYPGLQQVNASGRFPSPLYLSTTAGETPDPEQAVALFAYAEQELRQKPDAHQLLGRAVAYAMLKNYEYALADLNEAIALQPGLTVAYIERAFVRTAMAEALQSSRRHIDGDDRQTAEALTRNAITQAIKDLDTALGIDPDMIYALYDKALLSAKIGDAATALQCYDRLISLDSTLPQAYFNRGLLHEQQGRHSEAVADWSRAGELGLPKAYVLIRRAGRSHAIR